MLSFLLLWWLLSENKRPPERAHRYQSSEEDIAENVRLNKIQKERDARARELAKKENAS